MKIQNALVSNILDRSQRYFAHVTTVTLSWRVQNIVVIGRVYFTLECFEFSSNFEFDRNMLSGTGARSICWNRYNCCITFFTMSGFTRSWKVIILPGSYSYITPLLNAPTMAGKQPAVLATCMVRNSFSLSKADLALQGHIPEPPKRHFCSHQLSGKSTSCYWHIHRNILHGTSHPLSSSVSTRATDLWCLLSFYLCQFSHRSIWNRPCVPSSQCCSYLPCWFKTGTGWASFTPISMLHHVISTHLVLITFN